MFFEKARRSSSSTAQGTGRACSAGFPGTQTSPLAPRRLSGAGPGEGITNAGRLLGLGLALGVGAQVFGAPVASECCRGGGGPERCTSLRLP